jgi:hypothetical protein
MVEGGTRSRAVVGPRDHTNAAHWRGDVLATLSETDRVPGGRLLPSAAPPVGTHVARSGHDQGTFGGTVAARWTA